MALPQPLTAGKGFGGGYAGAEAMASELEVERSTERTTVRSVDWVFSVGVDVKKFWLDLPGNFHPVKIVMKSAKGWREP